MGREAHRALAGAPIHYERRRPEQTTLYRLVQAHVASFFAQAETVTGASVPKFVKDEFDAYLEYAQLARRDVSDIEEGGDPFGVRLTLTAMP